MGSRWTVYNKKGDEAAICAETGCPEVVARLLVNRDICEKEAVRRFLFPKSEDLYDPFLLKGIEPACEIILGEIRKGTHIRVVGDYDVDGVASAYILSDGLKKLGADVDVYLPHRVRDGYGINPDIVTKAYEEGTGLIVTCDNGISAFEAALKAKELGVRMIVTDHHEAGESISEADVVIDPKQSGCTYPFREICGAVVAAKVIEALNIKAGKKACKLEYIEYMCLATVCDVVPLSDENRTIVSLGLEALRTTENPGIRALLSAKQVEPSGIDEHKIGYVIGPCINAAGRLGDASLALSLLQEKDISEAEKIAFELCEMNEERKRLSEEAEKEAVHIIGEPDDDMKVLVVFIEGCHESILGIAAGRIREIYNRPAFVFTRSGELIKGSARGVPGHSLFEALTSLKDILVKFGGHALAAGLSMEEDKLDEFRERINAEWPLTVDQMIPSLKLEAVASFELMNESTVEWISKLAPFGVPNMRPVFADRDLTVESMRYMGRDNSSLRLCLRTSLGTPVTASSFFNSDETVRKLERMFGKEEVRCALAGKKNNMKITVAYEPQINEYNGLRSVQMIIRDIFEGA
ncbi:MAG: single-stranded-DNA-specific exonuclease RecJ [Lachnospiraceae bacterium]|nr:single-stranded-DNA-specific exonuclease RecJ [Lachnospiraceae bacterium]